MIKVCKQCGNEFEITENEAEFYKSKGLELPKRCGDCRKKNKKAARARKNQRNQKNQSSEKNNNLTSKLASQNTSPDKSDIYDTTIVEQKHETNTSEPSTVSRGKRLLWVIAAIVVLIIAYLIVEGLA